MASNEQMALMSGETRESFLLILDEGTFTFEKRAVAIAPDFRLLWRLALATLFVNAFRGRESSLERLYVINWAARTKNSQATLERALAGRSRPEDVVVRVDSTLDQVIDYAVGEGLMRRIATSAGEAKVVLTQTGSRMASEIAGVGECLEQEKQFLSRVGRQLTEDWVRRTVRVRPPRRG